MRLTAFTDFGLRTLLYLACLKDDQLSSVAEVSRVYRVSQSHMVKVIGQLAKSGYVQTIRGKNGGIRLAVKPELINIGDVIEQLENHLDGVDCATTACQLVPCCELKNALMEGMQAYLDTMRKYTLADLIVNKHQLIPLMTAV
ncbi:Rrf2 family transcriptional regulator [Amphritea sp. 2_MG-2023]|jgi:Rrf2 family nitric oxide-sensitive transcriptional repressor|uniref:Rrf2 family transcriptional regulator n=1 Tax=Amphritea TaxID=515417 RepID=UPI001C07EB07|nr:MULTISPECIES: Rrf2 family transcriptional regulator [Amphritea]MBU2966892.1 Rrf2 family transcriptional regulator [Amphritea atlantica]MDO6420108.1 Rrf2 family transcriptional regulator [Amphritea sp. 2_MG-2023]MDX2421384.1 Rrf2 family transcriptional regulator [Amphritea sp.]